MNTKLTKILISGGLGLALLAGGATAASAEGGPSGRPAGQEEAQARNQTRFANLTDEQKECLADAGVSRPTGRPTPEQRQALRQAAADCGIEIPAGGRPAGVGRPTGAGRPTSQADARARMQARFEALTDDQKECLSDAGLAKPEGRPTPAQRQALRDAAADCGIEIPAGRGGHGGARFAGPH